MTSARGAAPQHLSQQRPQPRLVVFAKAPQAGAVKTRLIPALGAQGAATLARRMLLHTLQQALAADVGPVELCMSPPPGAPEWHGLDLPASVELGAQGEGDLGERMARAVQRVTTATSASRNSTRTSTASASAHTSKAQPILLMGTDCPALDARRIAQAAQQLVHHDAVLVPVFDGGYVLIGLHVPCPSIFTDMAWSTPVVAHETLRRMAARKLHAWQAPMLHDIDEPADLVHLPPGFLAGDVA